MLREASRVGTYLGKEEGGTRTQVGEHLHEDAGRRSIWRTAQNSSAVLDRCGCLKIIPDVYN